MDLITYEQFLLERELYVKDFNKSVKRNKKKNKNIPKHVSVKIFKELNLKKVRFIGSGKMGDAYYVGDTKTLKITTDETEAYVAYVRKQSKNKKFPYFCKIYDVFRYTDPISNYPYYVIIQELVKVIKGFDSYNEKLILSTLIDKAENSVKNNFSKEDFKEDVESTLEYYLDDEFDDPMITNSEADKIRDMSIKFYDFFNKESNKNIYDYFTDIHTDNLGYDTKGELKIFDVRLKDFEFKQGVTKVLNNIEELDVNKEL